MRFRSKEDEAFAARQPITLMDQEYLSHIIKQRYISPEDMLAGERARLKDNLIDLHKYGMCLKLAKASGFLNPRGL